MMRTSARTVCAVGVLASVSTVAWSAQAPVTLQGHEDIVASVAFLADGKHVVTGSEDSTVRIWEASSGRCLRVLRGHKGGVTSVAAGGGRIATGGKDNTVRVWDANTGALLVRHDGVTGGGGGGGLVDRMLAQSTVKAVYAVALTPDGKRLASGNADHSVKVWALAGGRPAKQFGGAVSLSNVKKAGLGHSAAVSCVAFHPKGRLLASGSVRRPRTTVGILGQADKSEIIIWALTTGRSLRELADHTGPIRGLAYSPDGKILVSCGDDGTVKVWDVSRGQVMRTLSEHEGPVRSVAVCPAGRLAASGGDDTVVRLWNVQTGQCVKTLEGHAATVRSVAFSPDGSRVASASEDGEVCIWRLAPTVAKPPAVPIPNLPTPF